MKTFILTLFSIFTLLSCNSDDDSFVPQNIEQIMIGKGNLNGGSENISQQNIVIYNQSDFDLLMNAMNMANNVTDSFTETTVDFDSYMIIAAFDQIRNNGGHSIDIISVIENEENITIDVEKLQNGGVSSVITQPFHIVKIQKSDKPIVFQ